MATTSERINTLERLVAALVATAPPRQAKQLSQEFSILHVTDSQADAVRALLKSWVPLEGTEGGEFDPMGYLAERRGWYPLKVDEEMEIGIGDKRYKIHRVR